MANPQHLALLREGVETWNQWRKERVEEERENSVQAAGNGYIKKRYPHHVDLSDADLEDCDLSLADLSGANLRGARLVHANLLGADLHQADLYRAIFNIASLEYADLREAYLVETSMADVNLWRADLRNANLSWTSFFHAFLVEADLREADLTQTNFTWAVLSGAKVQGAYCNHTIFGDVDLSSVKGLEELHCSRPPLIDLYTLARSSGRLPESFLREAGIEREIIPSLLALFHSYGNDDSVWDRDLSPSSPWETRHRLQEPPQATVW